MTTDPSILATAERVLALAEQALRDDETATNTGDCDREPTLARAVLDLTAKLAEADAWIGNLEGQVTARIEECNHGRRLLDAALARAEAAERDVAIYEAQDGLKWRTELIAERETAKADRDRLRAALATLAPLLDAAVAETLAGSGSGGWSEIDHPDWLVVLAEAWTSLRPTVVAGEGGGT